MKDIKDKEISRLKKRIKELEQVEKVHKRVEASVERSSTIINSTTDAVITTDITELREARGWVLQEKDFTERMVNSLPGAFYMFNVEGRMLWWNENFSDVTGYTRDEISGMNALDFFAEEHKALVYERIQEVFAKGESSVEAEFLTKSGERIPYYLSGSRVDIEGETYLVGMGVDITDKKKAIEQLKESESKLREAWRMAKQGFWFWDIKTGQVEWSEEVYNIFHLDPDQFTPRIDSILKLSPWPEERERDQELIRRAIKDHKQGTYEQRFLRPDGSIGYYFSTFQGIYDDNGELIAMRGTVQDITDRKRSEEELKQYRDQLEDLVKKRTDELEKANAELKEKNVELERFHDATVDREFRMKELRNRIEELEKKLAGQ